MALKVDRLQKEMKKNEAELWKIENDKKILIRKNKELDKKITGQRLLQRGEILESYLKEPLTLVDEDIYELLRFLFSSPEAKKKEVDLLSRRKEKIIGAENKADAVKGAVIGGGLGSISRDISGNGYIEKETGIAAVSGAGL